MVDPELDALKLEFLTEAQEKVRDMEAALGQGDGALDRVAYIAHQLKGSGGSYGYQRISSEAAAIEKAVESDADANEEIRKHVQELHDEIDRRTRELSG